jgi:putative oxidoreductase
MGAAGRFAQGSVGLKIAPTRAAHLGSNFFAIHRLFVGPIPNLPETRYCPSPLALWGQEAMDLEAKLNEYRPQVLSILRIMVGLLYLSHGLQKWFAVPAAVPAYANLKLFSMLGIAGVIEIIFGSLVTVGLYARAAAFLLSGEMAVAYWIYVNRPARGFMPIGNGGELEVLYCFVFLYFVFAGAGPWSIDAAVRKRS